MSLPLSPAAQEAVDAASTDAFFRGDGHVTPEHLLVALLNSEDGAAGRFLRALSVDRDSLLARLDQCLSREEAAAERAILTGARMIELGEVGIRRILCSATDLADGYAATAVVPEHLLLAVAREAGTPAGRILADLGASDQELTGLIEAGLPEDWRDRAGTQQRLEQLDAREAKRAAVAGVLTFAGLVLLILFWGLSGWLLLAIDGSAEVVHDLTRPLAVKLLWATAIALATAVPFLERRRWGWCSCAGFLFAETASSTVSLAYAPWQTILNPLTWTPVVWNALVVWLVITGCFASRARFPIKHRERWRALMREGGWALASTAAVEAGTAAWMLWGLGKQS